MISDDERREVAARLRFTDHNLTWSEGCFCIAEDVGAAPNGNEHDDVLAFSHAIADLIDTDERTCHMTKKGPEFVLAGWWECSECGPVYPPCNDEIAVWALQRCPRCGAKVVE